MSNNFFNNLADVARQGGFVLNEEDDENNNDDRIDWRFLAAIDIHKIIQESNYEKIDECVPFLIKSTINSLFNTKVLDPTIGKIYTLSQLSLQYLSFCTKFLDKTVSSLRENVFNYQKQNINLQAEIEDRDAEIEQLRSQIKRAESITTVIFPCLKCSKKFESQTLLENHIKKKHSNEPKEKDSNLINTIKLELEIKQLKEKLNLTEKELMNVNNNKPPIECEKCRQNEMRVFKTVGIQSNSEEKEKDDREKEETSEKFQEFNESIRNFMAEQLKQFQEQKARDEERHLQELAKLNSVLDETVRTLKEHEMKQQKEAPSPAPRKTSVINEVPIHSNENENLWKIRFQELEKMYEYNQAQMAQSMKDVEKAYAEKMNKLEDSMMQLRAEKNSNSSTIKQVSLHHHHKQQIKMQPQEEATTESSDTCEESLDDINLLKKQPKIIQKVDKSPLQKSAYGNQKFEKVVQNRKTFSAQKNLTVDILPKEEAIKLKLEPKATTAINLFNNRMKEFNLPKHAKQLNRDEIERITSEMAERRENMKRQDKNYYITRKKIKSQVDEIYGAINKKSEDNSNQKFRNDLEKVLQKRLEDEKPKKKVLFNLYEKSNNMNNVVTSLNLK